MTPSMNDELQIVNQEDENSLSHYGVKGQKWGQRNYQNPDGTYTELGKERRRVAFIKAEKAKEEDAKNQNSSDEDYEGEKIGGKAYKDMTRRELRAAKKRARHNEKERRAQREFNRDKREAIEAGDMSFISKNISKFTNDEIDETIARLKRMQAIKDIEAANKQRSEKYIDKALKFLDKASNATNSLTNIYNKINESQQKSIQKKKALKDLQKASLEYDYMVDPENKPLSILDKLKNKNAEIANQKLAEETRQARSTANMLNVDDRWHAYMDSEKAKDYKNLSVNEFKDKWGAYDVASNKGGGGNKKNKGNNEDGKKKDKDKDDNKDSEKYEFSWQEDDVFGSQPGSKKTKIGSTKSKDFDLDDKSVNKITKKYIGQFKDAPKDYFKEDQVRDDQWRKDMKKHDADVVDKWVKDMKKKYMKERNMDAKAAEQKAEDYVESWLEAYDEDLLKELKK